MKKLFLLSAIVVASMFAAPVGGDFAANKAKMVENIDKRIAVLNEFKECSNKAIDQTAMRECKKSEQDKMKTLKNEMKPGKGGMGNMHGMKHDGNMSGMGNMMGGGKGCKACPETNATK